MAALIIFTLVYFWFASDVYWRGRKIKDAWRMTVR